MMVCELNEDVFEHKWVEAHTMETVGELIKQIEAPKCKVIMDLILVRQYKSDEVAKELKLSRNTVQNHALRGIMKLRKIYKQQ